jgi:hypothetical protein
MSLNRKSSRKQELGGSRVRFNEIGEYSAEEESNKFDENKRKYKGGAKNDV